MYKIITKFYENDKKAEADAKKIRLKNIKAEVDHSPKGFPMVILGQYKYYHEAEEALKKLFYKVECYFLEC